MNGMVSMTLPMTFSFFTVHWSGSSLASPFVMNPSSVMLVILWVIDVGSESSKQIMSPVWRVSGLTGLITTMLPTGMAGSMLPV